MAGKSGSSFGDFVRAQAFDLRSIKPISTEFSKGSVPNSIYSANRESSWTRWRRGYEIACASLHDNNYNYNFKYDVPFASGVLPSGTTYPPIYGSFLAFPTKSREFKVHWAGERRAGSIRLDQVSGAYNLYISSVTEDNDYWYAQLNGTWSSFQQLPPPLYIDLGVSIEGLKPLVGEILEDRIISPNGNIIVGNTINPQTQKRYGYVQAVVVDINENNGIIKLKKAGSVESTPDNKLITPASRPPNIGRYFITGARYACTCQDFTHREYSYLRDLGDSNKKAFPRTSVASIKPGRYDILTRLGVVDSSAMTKADVDRILEIFAPNQNLNVATGVTTNTNIDQKGTRDFPGVFKEFGSIYLRENTNPDLSGSKPGGMPKYEDYASQTVSTDANSIPQVTITSVTDIWVPVLDELRYCKHIYAMRFQDHIFPPEPSDFPVDIDNMVNWEQKLITENAREQSDGAKSLAAKALSYMDIPPYNCQSQVMQPMIQRLFNLPLTYIKISGFTMYDKNGLPYVPALGEKPGT